MKRTVIFFLVVICFVVAVENNKHSFSFANFFNQYEIMTYTKYEINEHSDKLGTVYITPYQSDIRKSKVLGESFVCDASNFERLLKTLKADIVKKETIEGRFIVYAYTAHNRNYVTLQNNKVNLQICINDEQMTVGWPLILGSF